MDKLVVLELAGDLPTLGFRATLEMHLEGSLHPIKIKGYLPANPTLATHLQHHWEENYGSLVSPMRIKPQKIIYKGSLNKQIAECKESALELRERLRAWLDSEAFRGIDRRLREEFNREEAIRFLIRTEDKHLHKLPWQEWDFFERYPKAEIALSAVEFEPPKKSQVVTHKEKVRILAILGNSDGIDIDVDRRKLEALPDAEVEFLVEPERRQLNDKLWEQPWDILFFAGHSKTFGQTGRIYINQTDSLSLNELKYGLKKAIAQGLQLAIFNSCDGLGLAHELEQLHIPQMIVMREPVPDKVAQEFLNYFLRAFANGDSLYLAERQARERLQGLEQEFPCASWLPVICQNSVEVPPDWLMLRGQVDAELTHHSENPPNPPILGRTKAKFLSSLTHCGGGWERQEVKAMPTGNTQPLSPKRCSFRTVLGASVVVTSLVMGVRALGLLQAWELQAFDQLMRLRPAEKQDPRLLVVEATEEDINRYGFPLPDATLAQVVEKLETHQPRVIGLDIFRDRPRQPGHAALASHLQHNSRLIALCSVREAYNPNKPGIAPPRGLSDKRLGFSDLVVDPDGILRRHLLFMQPNPTDPCATDHSLSVRVALHYLAAEGIKPQSLPKDKMQLGKAVFTPLEANTGAYQQLDARGFQVLLNYRAANNVAQRVRIAEVLSGKVNPNWVKDRIVLIGVSAPVSADDFFTPYSAGKWPYKKMPGVLVQAQMASHILSAVLDKRPLLWTWSKWGEVCWVWGWSLVGGLIVWRIHRRIYLVLAATAAIGVLYGVCFGLLIEGGWVPLVPSALALVATCGSVIAFTASQNRQ